MADRDERLDQMQKRMHGLEDEIRRARELTGERRDPSSIEPYEVDHEDTAGRGDSSQGPSPNHDAPGP